MEPTPPPIIDPGYTPADRAAAEEIVRTRLGHETLVASIARAIGEASRSSARLIIEADKATESAEDSSRLVGRQLQDAERRVRYVTGQLAEAEREMARHREMRDKLMWPKPDRRRERRRRRKRARLVREAQARMSPEQRAAVDAWVARYKGDLEMKLAELVAPPTPEQIARVEAILLGLPWKGNRPCDPGDTPESGSESSGATSDGDGSAR